MNHFLNDVILLDVSCPVSKNNVYLEIIWKKIVLNFMVFVVVVVVAECLKISI